MVYKFLGIWLDSALSFSHHVTMLQLKAKAKRMIVQMNTLPLFDYEDTIYRLACKRTLQKLETIYHSAIQFAPECLLQNIPLLSAFSGQTALLA